MIMTTGSSPLETSPAMRRARLGAEGALAAGFRADPERFSTNEEPPLEDLFDDPIVTRLMASDGLQGDVVRAMVSDVRARLDGGR